MNANTDWSDSHGFIELDIDLEDAATGYHMGQCDDDIDALRQVPYIAKQLSELSADVVANVLREYGAWSAEDLANHDDNLSRLLWIACGDILDNSKTTGEAA
jgi:hypothetical protein